MRYAAGQWRFLEDEMPGPPPPPLAPGRKLVVLNFKGLKLTCDGEVEWKIVVFKVYSLSLTDRFATYLSYRPTTDPASRTRG